MSIARINEFRAREGQEEALRELIRSFVPGIREAEGCLSCQLYQAEEDPARIVVFEIWDTKENHQASAQRIPPETLQKAMALLEAPPSGSYLRMV